MSSHTDEFWLNETDLSVDDYIYFHMRACVMVIIVENGIGGLSSNPAWIL